MTDHVDNPTRALAGALDRTLARLDRAVDRHRPGLRVREFGTVRSVDHGIAKVSGLPRVAYEEMVTFETGEMGLALDLGEHEVGVVVLGDDAKIRAGIEVERTGRVLQVPVGEALLGRVVNPLGEPLDRHEPVHAAAFRPVERPAPEILERAPVTTPLQTGIVAVDAMVPIGRGQRELIVGDRQTGKTAIAIDTILNQRDKDVLCVYCAIGQRNASVAHAISELRERGALDYTVVVVAESEDPPGLQFIAPYAATSIAEYFMRNGRDVLVVYDDLTQHARAYREISLLMRRPPGREAFPGDIFYLHSRLLERATHLRDEHGGGSLTALPIIETEAENISAYIPTNLISITDGQIYLSPKLFHKDIVPAVDVGRSVSRVGGKTQLPAFRAVASELRLAYSQFEELETFSRFGTRLDEDTRRTLEHGRRVREVLKQPQYQPQSAAEQVIVLVAASENLFDDIPVEDVQHAARQVRDTVPGELPYIVRKIKAGEKLQPEDRAQIIDLVQNIITLNP
ncbi:alternate F1F0 ATPase, F1 subunit alpha [Persicimonas caeni]|uniref:alternate F1F0 ATPase, F1 subunit alpha n=1 Tax=Persicimonas caeni TaxID=2292766 RepID=UPI00157FD497|nr:alternate F1F0 ATPase, F1 subunit alpha [Persicimonas caeni]